MTDVLLRDATYEELSREVEARLNTGLFDTLGLYSSEQQNYRAMWGHVTDRLNELCLQDFERYQPLRDLTNEAMRIFGGDHVQAMRVVFGVNTTFPGRKANEDHAPKENDDER